MPASDAGTLHRRTYAEPTLWVCHFRRRVPRTGEIARQALTHMTSRHGIGPTHAQVRTRRAEVGELVQALAA